MRRLSRWLVLCLILVPAAGCGVSKDKPAAEAVAAKFHAALQVKNYNDAIGLCHPDLFKQTPERDFRELLTFVNKKLGDYQSAKLVGWSFRKQAMTSGPSGTFYVLTYQTTYAKYPADEQFVIYKPLGGNRFSVLGYHINSTGLFKETQPNASEAPSGGTPRPRARSNPAEPPVTGG